MIIRINKKPFRKITNWLKANPEKPLIYSLWIAVVILSYYATKYFFKAFNPSQSINVSQSNLTGVMNELAPFSSSFIPFMVLSFAAVIIYQAIKIVRGSLQDAGF